MGIIYNEASKTITLHTKHSSYQMKIGNLDYLLHLYYGPSIRDEDMSYQIMQYDRGFSGNPYESRDERTFSLDAQPQEFSTQQQGDFRTASIEVVNGDGSYSYHGKAVDYKISKGKYQLDTLPCVFATENDTVDTVEVTLSDEISNVQVVLLYSVFEEADIITRAVKVINSGNTPIHLRKIMSVCIDFFNGLDFDLVSLPGRYGQERQVERQRMTHHIHTIGSVRGSSSHQQNPFVILCDKNATEDYGKCYGFSLMYSGNFLAEAELDQYDQLRLVMGIHPKQFVYELKPQETFEGPEVVMAFTEHGFTGLSHLYHDFYRTNLCRSKFVQEVQRPVLINSWEAAFMDFDDVKLVEIAKAARNMGVDLLVMDDGWFGKRDLDVSGLGDWTVNEKKLGCTLKELSDQIHSLGLQFGIWFEPEGINEDSDLYREHPDWAFTVPGKQPTRSRLQLLLDFSREDVREYIFSHICQILDSARIEYLKWDLNRSLADLYSASLPAKRQGEVMHRYVLGLYDMLEKLTQRYPDMLIEGCSGGGGRFDAGMLYYTPQIWCSDNTDAIDRLAIQYGTSFCYPVSTMGAHVSAVPNAQTGRSVSMETRGVVAMAGTFGYEMDLNHTTAEEKQTIKRQVAFFKEHYELIQRGDYYRLSDPFHDPFTAWQQVSPDRREALVSLVTHANRAASPFRTVRLRGLDPDAQYRVDGGETWPGDVLMAAGFPLPMPTGDYQSMQLYLQAE